MQEKPLLATLSVYPPPGSEHTGPDMVHIHDPYWGNLTKLGFFQLGALFYGVLCFLLVHLAGRFISSAPNSLPAMTASSRLWAD